MEGVASASREEDAISIVLITSPCPSMPALTLINHTLDSLQRVIGLENYLRHIYILMDGFKSAQETRFKKGRISDKHQQLYDDYHSAINATYGTRPNFTVVRSSEHLGFAMIVKWGLELCRTKFALILQHDRYFRQKFDQLPQLLHCFNTHNHIRYIGFTTGNSHKHDLLLRSNYHLEFITNNERVVIDNNSSLQPLVFWFDSQHLAHVQRYLEIFTPHRSISEYLRPLVGLEGIKSMKLRKGDFIEDRFGQAQRNLFLHWQQSGRSEQDILQLFRWFGSYLYWQLEADRGEEGPSAAVFVRHLHGRSLDMNFLDSIASTFGVDKISSRQHRLLLTGDSSEIQEDENRDVETVAAIRSERRKQQVDLVNRLLQQNGHVMDNQDVLGEAMQLLQFDGDDSIGEVSSDNSPVFHT
jgi:hypothetical protein